MQVLELGRDAQSNNASPLNPCLAPEVRVLVWEQGHIAVGEIAVGSLLVVPPSHARVRTAAVRDIRRYKSSRLIRINHKIDCTEGHPFLATSGNWVCARELAVGDWLMGASGPVRIENIEPVCRTSGTVIDVCVDHPFRAEGFVTMSKSAFRQRGVLP